jgi:murein DD-endopeptidase MepM/ murein hydrolase activator NlpD
MLENYKPLPLINPQTNLSNLSDNLCNNLNTKLDLGISTPENPSIIPASSLGSGIANHSSDNSFSADRSENENNRLTDFVFQSKKAIKSLRNKASQKKSRSKRSTKSVFSRENTESDFVELPFLSPRLSMTMSDDEDSRDSLSMAGFLSGSGLFGKSNNQKWTIQKTIFRTDTSNLYDVKLEGMVQVNEEMAIDCVWIKTAEYFQVWDTENINPYDFKVEDWKDTVNIQLFDSMRDQKWSSPLASLSITSNFGHRWYRWHGGVDLDLNTGDPVYAAFDGIVRLSKSMRGGYGNFVVLRHLNGLETLYGHLSKLGVKAGEVVKAGEEIGKGGSTGRSTGPHLHYEVRYRGHAFDPNLIYDFDSARIRTDLFNLTPEHFGYLNKSRRQTVHHIVQEGETLYKISLLHRISVRQLCRLNRINSKTMLREGRKLRIR